MSLSAAVRWEARTRLFLGFLEGKVSDLAMAIVEDFTDIFERINFLLVVMGRYFM